MSYTQSSQPSEKVDFTPSYNIDQAISNLTPGEQELFKQWGFGPVEDVKYDTVHKAFAQHVKSRPYAIAAEQNQPGGGKKSITYAELDKVSDKIARQLRTKYGVAPNSRTRSVALVVSRSVEMVVAIISVLKAGGRYIPLDGGVVPEKVLKHVIGDVEAGVVLCLSKHKPKVQKAYDDIIAENKPAFGIMAIEEAMNAWEPEQAPIEDLATGKDGCYVIYTSGTTGPPKGVQVNHGNVTNLVCTSPGNVAMAPGLKVSQLLSISFDMAAWEILGSMSNGCTLVLRTNDWKSAIAEVNVVIATPTILSQYEPSDFPNVRYVATAGEPCPDKLADLWGTHARYHNCCGPTEITIVNTVHQHVPKGPNTIGKPTPNNNIYILDVDTMKPTKIGEKGVVWAGGAGITDGYVRLPEKTAEKYLPDPFVKDSRAMMFNTGDLGRWDEFGNVVPLGRIDDQVKIKGFRIELDGVSLAMETTPGVVAACAIAIKGELWGFVSPDTIDIADVKYNTGLAQPYYAIPTKYKLLEAFPMTANGKIDKRALKALVEDPEAAAAAAPAPVVAEPKKFVDHSKMLTSATVITVPAASLHSGATVRYETFLSKEKDVEGAAAHHTKEIPGSSDTSVTAKSVAHPYSTYIETDVPGKKYPGGVRNMRYIILIVYRRLFSMVFLANIGILISFLARGNVTSPKIATAVAGNLCVAVLMRQDHVINLLFWLFCSIPQSWPLIIRRNAAKIYHIGGLHSGCATSSVVWLIYFAAHATVQYTSDTDQITVSMATLVLTYVTLALLCSIVLFAWPAFRVVSHNAFEMIHRFSGWTALAFVWAQTVLLINDFRPLDQSLGKACTQSSGFWLLVVITSSIIYPWIHLRKVNVRTEVLSNHCARLHFDYATPVAGSFTRISTRPLFEWHSFATVPLPGKTGFSLIVSKAGDWTTRQISHPPTQIWVRGLPTCGVMRIAPLFRKLIIVATGSGIGPCLSAFVKEECDCRILWSTQNPRATFGDEIVDSVYTADPNAIVWDTRANGKPDMVQLCYALFKEFEGAEAVVIISNTRLTKKVVYGMESRGIPAYGAIWDS